MPYAAHHPGDSDARLPGFFILINALCTGWNSFTLL
jgi:hypothetical protein